MPRKLTEDCDCLQSYRYGRDNYGKPDRYCHKCSGTGQMPNEFGKEILDFIKLHGEKEC